MTIVFGPAGIPIGAKGNNVDGLNHSINLGLGAYEVEFVRGARMTPLMAREMQVIRDKNNIRVSCHAPYFINCNNPDKYGLTRKHLLDCIKVSQDLRFTRIVFHTGYLMGQSRGEALKTCIKTIKRVINDAYDKGYKNFILGPETNGKKSQVGTTEELIAICKECKECRPVIDWAHLHATSNGGLKTEQDFKRPLELIERELGKTYLKELHCHFSNIEYTDKGEVRHWPLDSKWGPDFNVLARVIKDYDFTIICESPLIEKDALKMKSILNKM
ncbi:MAG: TIM barrel protein [Candidatus Nanoarchaeia archaeon]|jgi:deoxyribonuclease-4